MSNNPPKKPLTRKQKLQIAESGFQGAKSFVSGGSADRIPSTSANDSAPSDWTPEPVSNRTKEENTTDLEEKTPKSFLSNYNVA